MYTLAIDRGDEEVAKIYDPGHLSVLKLINMTARSAEKNNIPVSVCGEMAGDHQFTRLLLGMGLRSFSMHPSAIPEVKKIIVESNISELEKVSLKILNCVDTKEKHKLIKRLNQKS